MEIRLKQPPREMHRDVIDYHKEWLTSYYEKMKLLQVLAQKVRRCKRCPGFNQGKRGQIPERGDGGCTLSAPGFGNANSPIVFVGQSLCTECMFTQVPFTRGSGDLLDAVFLSLGVYKFDYFVTNTVKCHPPGNRPSRPAEIYNCRRFLRMELQIIRPLLVVALGNDARSSLKQQVGITMSREHMKVHNAKTNFLDFPIKSIWFRHPASFLYQPDPIVERLWFKRMREIVVAYDGRFTSNKGLEIDAEQIV